MKPRTKLKHAREAAQLSQAALARLVGTSQQQIHRIEIGHTIRLDQARRIAAALGAELDALFPETRTVARQLQSKKSGREEAEADPVGEGIDADPRMWTARFRMRSGLKKDYVVSSRDAQRIRYALDAGSASVSFDSDEAEVFVNLHHSTYVHLRWDAPWDREVSRQGPSVSVWFDGVEPHVFSVEPAFEESEDEENAGAEDVGELRDMLVSLELHPEAQDFVSFDDYDGERVSLRVPEIFVLEISHSTFAGLDDDDHEETNDDVQSTQSRSEDEQLLPN